VTTSETEKRVEEFRARNADKIAQINAAEAERKRVALEKERAEFRALRRRVVIESVEVGAGFVIRAAAAVLVYKELSSVAWALVFWATLETIAGKNRQQ
jgi:hypothetical protein